jgi:hypothetical protein
MQGYRKMIIKGGDVTVVRGHWKADDESVTVLSAYDQLKTMYLKGSTPRGLARLQHEPWGKRCTSRELGGIVAGRLRRRGKTSLIANGER